MTSRLEVEPQGRRCQLYRRHFDGLAVSSGSAAPIRRREQRTVDGPLASTSIERLLSGFGPRERDDGLRPQYLVNRSVATRSFGSLYDRLWPTAGAPVGEFEATLLTFKP